jgi:hypothetical protein
MEIMLLAHDSSRFCLVVLFGWRREKREIPEKRAEPTAVSKRERVTHRYLISSAENK